MSLESFTTIRREPSPRKKWAKRTGIFAAGVILGVGGTLGVQTINQHYDINIRPIKPGGMWESPENGAYVDNIIHFAAKAYPTQQGDPSIAFVDFNAEIKDTKLLACHVPASPPQVTKFTCDWEIPPALQASNQKIIVSFDVHDQKGNTSNAQNGLHTVFEN